MVFICLCTFLLSAESAGTCEKDVPLMYRMKAEISGRLSAKDQSFDMLMKA